jgi:hypothetical protein
VSVYTVFPSEVSTFVGGAYKCNAFRVHNSLSDTLFSNSGYFIAAAASELFYRICRHDSPRGFVRIQMEWLTGYSFLYKVRPKSF